jgi:hypothetical protein
VRLAFWNVRQAASMRPWRAALHFVLQQRRKSDTDERREKRAVAHANSIASSTSRSVSTVAAGTVPTGVAQTRARASSCLRAVFWRFVFLCFSLARRACVLCFCVWPCSPAGCVLCLCVLGPLQRVMQDTYMYMYLWGSSKEYGGALGCARKGRRLGRLGSCL